MKNFEFKIGKYTVNNKINILNERPLIAVFVDTTFYDKICPNGHTIPILIFEFNHHHLFRLLKNPLGYCGCCQRYFVYPNRYHRNTAYVKVECNYGYLCKDCQEEEHAYYQELWDDYWASRL